jgi:hypothetical protein
VQKIYNKCKEIIYSISWDNFPWFCESICGTECQSSVTLPKHTSLSSKLRPTQELPLPLTDSPSYPTLHLPSRQRVGPATWPTYNGSCAVIFDPTTRSVVRVWPNPANHPQTDDRRQRPSVEVTEKTLSPLNQSPKLKTIITWLACGTIYGHLDMFHHHLCVRVRQRDWNAIIVLDSY